MSGGAFDDAAVTIDGLRRLLDAQQAQLDERREGLDDAEAALARLSAAFGLQAGQDGDVTDNRPALPDTTTSPVLGASAPKPAAFPGPGSVGRTRRHRPGTNHRPTRAIPPCRSPTGGKRHPAGRSATASSAASPSRRRSAAVRRRSSVPSTAGGGRTSSAGGSARRMGPPRRWRRRPPLSAAPRAERRGCDPGSARRADRRRGRGDAAALLVVHERDRGRALLRSRLRRNVAPAADAEAAGSMP